MQRIENLEKKVIKIFEIFDEIYSKAICSLKYKKPIELLVAAELSAQCTDKRVNEITKDLFKKYKSVQDFANANLKELENDIKSAGFYHNKARNIILGCNYLIQKHNGIIPTSLNELIKILGVGRKTANLLLGELYNIPGMVVDTHVTRLSHRIGLSTSNTAEKIEYDLMKIIPKEKWSKFGHQLIYHGRAICTARNPKCAKCQIEKYCEKLL